MTGNGFHHVVSDESGGLAFEWIALITLMVVGIVGGLSTARDAILSELTDIAAAATAIDQSFSIGPSPCGGNGFNFQDDPGQLVRCERGGPAGQPPAVDCGPTSGP